MTISRILFELLQVSLGNRDRLTYTPSAEEWHAVLELASRQTVVGTCLPALTRLKQQVHEKKKEKVGIERMERNTFLHWLVLSLQIERKNSIINEQCVEIQRFFKKAGWRSCILKGQGVGAYYGELACFRSSGDIDIWVDAKNDELIDFVQRNCSGRKLDVSSKHIEMPYFKDTIVEVHFKPSGMAAFPYKHRMATFYNTQKRYQMDHKVALSDGNVITSPDHIFNSIFILNHIFCHFIFEGVGLRQMMDWYFVMTSDFTSKEQEIILRVLKNTGLYKFAQAAAYILIEVFGMRRERLFIPVDQKAGLKMLYTIIEEGNMGKYDENRKRVNTNLPLARFVYHTRRQIKFFALCPAEVLWSPISRFLEYFWRVKNDYIR